MTDRFAPLWDVLEEHLEEAGFLWGAWERSLVAPNYTLEEVATTVEPRLAAHLDALVIGGPQAADRLLVPALESDDSEVVCAAAAALLLGGDAAGLERVIEALHELPESRPALVRALQCSERAEVPRRLRACLADVDEAIVGAAAEVLSFHHLPLGDAIPVLLASDDPGLRGVGLRALTSEPPAASHARALQAALADPELQVVDAAIDAGVLLAPAATWPRVRARAGELEPSQALLLLALRGEAGDRDVVLAALSDPSRRAAAIHALGHVGAPELVDACLEWLEDASCGPLVGEMLAALTGADLEDAELTLPPSDDDEPLVHTPEQDLPRPDPMPTMQWWLRQRPRLADGQRYLAGRPRTREEVLAALTHGPMRRRPALLLDLQLRARGPRPRLQTRAPTPRQRAELAALQREPAGG